MKIKITESQYLFLLNESLKQIAVIMEEDFDYINNEDYKYRSKKIKVVDSSDPKIRINKDGELECGNIFYHGAMLNDIKKEELPQYFSKTGTRFESKQKRLSGKPHEALFLTPSFREASMWASQNIRLEFYGQRHFNEPPKREMASNVSASVYKVTLKPNIILLREVITHFGYGEKERVERNGACGTYGGVYSKPSTISMMECGIVNPECISDWVLVSKGDEFLKSVSDDTINTAIYNKNMNPHSFRDLMKSMGIEEYDGYELNRDGSPSPIRKNNQKWDEYAEKFLDDYGRRAL